MLIQSSIDFYNGTGSLNFHIRRNKTREPLNLDSGHAASKIRDRISDFIKNECVSKRLSKMGGENWAEYKRKLKNGGESKVALS